jgi:DNA-binding response OmpR family regulator
MRLLLVEDDQMMGESLQLGLQLEGYAVDWVRNAAAARTAALTNDYGAIILDLGLPDDHGLRVLREWRARGMNTPLIVVTASDGLDQRIAGLDAGADDYVLKPFDLDELTARIRALRRRHHGRAGPLIRLGDIEIDPTARRVWRCARPVELTAREFAVALFLAERAGRVVSRGELEDALYAWSREIGSNVVEVYISQLRRKLGPGFIVTRRGLGYCVEHA